MCHKVESAPRSRPAPPPAHTYKTVPPELHTAVQRLKLMKLFIAGVMFLTLYVTPLLTTMS